MPHTSLEAPSIHALWVTDSEVSSAVKPVLRDAGIELVILGNCGQARQFLRDHPELGIVLTDVTLPDGNWSTVFQDSVRSGLNAPIVVCAQSHNPRLWVEVVQRGCHFLLAAKGLGTEAVRLIRQVADIRATRASAGTAYA